MIKLLKDCIWRGPMKDPVSFWMNHLTLTLLLLHIIVSWMMGIALFLLATGHQPLLPSLAVPRLPLLPKQLTLDEEKAYLAEVSCIITQL